MAKDFIDSTGRAVTQPRFVAEVGNNIHHGRYVLVRDNFRHLDGGPLGAGTVHRVLLGEKDAVLPILAELGFRLGGNWTVNRRTA